MATSVMQVRVDDELKAQAAAIYEDLGIDLSTAIRMFLKRTVIQNGITFSMTLPRKDYKADRAVRAADMTLEDINAEIAATRAERAAASEEHE